MCLTFDCTGEKITLQKTSSHPSYFFLLPLHSMAKITLRNNQNHFLANPHVGITANILFLQFLPPLFLYFRSHCVTKKESKMCILTINEVNYRSCLFREGNCFQLNKEIQGLLLFMKIPYIWPLKFVTEKCLAPQENSALYSISAARLLLFFFFPLSLFFWPAAQCECMITSTIVKHLSRFEVPSTLQ